MEDDMGYDWKKTAGGWMITRRAAIVDLPQQGLSNIFIPGTEELVPEVKKNVERGLQKISRYLESEHPGVRIVHHEMIGAAVTMQYSPTSDIDNTVFINVEKDDPRFGVINRWIGNNVDGGNFRGRPYQFKIQPASMIGNNDNADVVYLPGAGFKKRPEAGMPERGFHEIVDNPNSEERLMYAQMEPQLQAIAARWAREARAALAGGDPSSYMAELGGLAAEMVAKVKEIGKMRGQAYGRGVDQGRISQNWNRENVIYKFLERDGYNGLLYAVKEALADGELHPQELMHSISLAEAVMRGGVGFDPRGDDPTAHVTFGRGEPTESQRRRIGDR